MLFGYPLHMNDGLFAESARSNTIFITVTLVI
jgi:hypothetical protein